MPIVWSDEAWADYLWWQSQDRKILRRINALIKDALRGDNAGIGKPERLKGNLSGNWSRRITEEHRLVYYLESDRLHIVSCRYHYE